VELRRLTVPLSAGTVRHAGNVRRAGEQALDRLEPMLTELRAFPELRERKRGTFYRGSRAFIHFHEDPTGLFADVRFREEFERFDVTTVAEQKSLAHEIRAALRITT
jgi:hypothetical protein